MCVKEGKTSHDRLCKSGANWYDEYGTVDFTSIGKAASQL